MGWSQSIRFAAHTLVMLCGDDAEAQVRSARRRLPSGPTTQAAKAARQLMEETGWNITSAVGAVRSARAEAGREGW